VMASIGTSMESILTKLPTQSRCGLCMFRCAATGACSLRRLYVSEYMVSCYIFDKYNNLVDTVAGLDTRMRWLTVAINKRRLKYANNESRKM